MNKNDSEMIYKSYRAAGVSVDYLGAIKRARAESNTAAEYQRRREGKFWASMRLPRLRGSISHASRLDVVRSIMPRAAPSAYTRGRRDARGRPAVPSWPFQLCEFRGGGIFGADIAFATDAR